MSDSSDSARTLGRSIREDAPSPSPKRACVSEGESASSEGSAVTGGGESVVKREDEEDSASDEGSSVTVDGGGVVNQNEETAGSDKKDVGNDEDDGHIEENEDEGDLFAQSYRSASRK